MRPVALAAAAAVALLAATPPVGAQRRAPARVTLSTQSVGSALTRGALRVRVSARRLQRVSVRSAFTRTRVLRVRRSRLVALRLNARAARRFTRCRRPVRFTLLVKRGRRTLARRRVVLRCNTRGATPIVGQVPDTAYWPSMRHDARNTGRSDVQPRYRGGRPWTFRTGKGIFSTPIIGPGGTVYVGSADTRFYALDGGTGKPRWTFATGGIVDAAGALDGDALVMGSGDEKLYRLKLDDGRKEWELKATAPPATGQLVNWWEGNVARGPDGDFYAGNTGGAAYRIGRDGKERWRFQTGNSVWTTPAFGPDGTTYWGSLDLNVYALDRDGKQKWKTGTVGYVVSSPAISRDGKTLYVGSFDGRLYALDAQTGAVRWFFQTRDHVYSSPALEEDASGRVTSIYIGSTDGSVYAVTPDGRQRWRYDTGDPVRSSPVLGGGVLYVGSSDGSLYALDAAKGTRRWSYDTTPDDPALRDRNDLNGSPALGPDGIVIGGEHGTVTHVPYDYCLQRTDARCTKSPAQPLGDDLARIFPVTSGGATRPGGLASFGRTAPLFTRLVVRERGRTVDAALQSATVVADPPFPFTQQVSGDGHHVFVVPDGFLEPGREHRVTISGSWTGEGPRPTGTGQVGATRGGQASDTLVLRTPPASGAPLPLSVSPDEVAALRLRRLAVPLPAFLTSVNQIGFDSYDLIAGTLAVSPPDASGEGRVLLWVIGGKPGADGSEVADPKAGFGFPIAGRYRGGDFILSRRDLNLTFSFGEVPARRFELRGRLGPDLRVEPGASAYVEVFCPEVPNYGPQLLAIGLCNKAGVLPAGGTFLTERYDPRGGASRRPPGLQVGDIALTRPTSSSDGEVSAALSGSYPVSDHVVSIVLADAETHEPVTVDYVKATSIEAGRVRVTLPRGTEVPARVRAFVVADAFGVAEKIFG